MKITRKVLREWKACYGDDKIRKLIPAGGLTPLEILDLDIPAKDRLWVVLRESVITPRDLRLLAVKWARGALKLAGNPDPRSVAACDVAERFANGHATADELAVACDAALDAAQAAARNAALDAACDTALDAAWAAVLAAARSAARSAAGAFTRDAQIADVRVVLEGK